MMGILLLSPFKKASSFYWILVLPNMHNTAEFPLFTPPPIHGDLISPSPVYRKQAVMFIG